MLLHQSYLQTPSKILESNFIQDRFLNLEHKDISGRIYQLDNKIYQILLSNSVSIYYIQAGDFEPSSTDPFLFNVNKVGNKRWLSVLYGNIFVQHYIKIVSGGQTFKDETNSNLTLLYSGDDELAINHSLSVEADTIIGITIDTAEDMLLFVYESPNDSRQSFYIGERIKSKLVKTKTEITTLKKAMRETIKNAEVLSRMESRSNNLF